MVKHQKREEVNKMNLDSIVVSNIKYFLQQRGLQIGDFEKKLGLCVGYFSRHNKNISKQNKNRESSISLSLAVQIAQEFGITVDDLCSDIRLKDLQKTAEEYGLKLVPLDSEVEE